MKLAQALTERADIQKRVEQLRSRLLLNARVQEGDTPAEDPGSLLEELEALTRQLEDLICRINLTNAATVSEGETLTALLARRDCCKLRLSALRDFLEAASAKVTRVTRSEVVIRSSVHVPALQKEVDHLSRQLRELDLRIQELNWTTELM